MSSAASVNKQLEQLHDGGWVGDALCGGSLAVANFDRQVAGPGVERGESSLVGHVVTDVQRCV